MGKLSKTASIDGLPAYVEADQTDVSFVVRNHKASDVARGLANSQ